MPCSVKEWGVFFLDPAKRRVAEDEVYGTRISTVFLGLDHNLYDNGPPLLFETRAFGGVLDESQMRCSTWDEAVIQHAVMVQRVVAACKPPPPPAPPPIVGDKPPRALGPGKD